MREKAKSADIQREVDQSEGKGSLESGGHLQQLDDFFDSDEPFEADNTFAFIVEKMFVRTDEEMEALEKAIDESTTRDERRKAYWRVELAQLRDDALKDARTNRAKPNTYRQLAFDEFSFRAEKAKKLESQQTSVDELRKLHPQFSITKGGFRGEPGRHYGIAKRFAIYFLSQRPNGNLRDFAAWYCNRALEGDIAITSPKTSNNAKTKKTTLGHFVFDVIDENLGDNDPEKFEVAEVNDDGVTINAQCYGLEALRSALKRAKKLTNL